ncbi:unnamed protein product [Triticum turgidum subsp. durum]|uniref:Auxin-responsive protein n=1 Tax=Triticum turgidum subsp. durum TaxID=4567 RepID=A0A9R0XEW1_TRITD|nr:unnamed protein product [Triticum turgidum subsp. durum]
MIHSKKLAQLAKKWQRKVVAGAGGQQTGESCSTVADKGHCVVYAADGARFEVPLAYLLTTVFGELLRMSGEEFGFANSEGGRIMLPCDAVVVERKMENNEGKLYIQELQTASCWCSATCGTIQLGYWQGITTEFRNALSTSSQAFLLSKQMSYSTAASKGSVILLSNVNPYSS